MDWINIEPTSVTLAAPRGSSQTITCDSFALNEDEVVLRINFAKRRIFDVYVPITSPTKLAGTSSTSAPNKYFGTSQYSGDLFKEWLPTKIYMFRWYDGSRNSIDDTAQYTYLYLNKSELKNLKNFGVWLATNDYSEERKSWSVGCYLKVDISKYLNIAFNFTNSSSSFLSGNGYIYENGSFKKIKEAHITDASGNLKGVV